MKRANAVGKTLPIDFLKPGLPQTFNLKKKNTVSTKSNKVKHNGTRYGNKNSVGKLKLSWIKITFLSVRNVSTLRM